MFEGASFQFIKPQGGFSLRLPNGSSVIKSTSSSRDWWISTPVWHLLYGIGAMNRAFSSSCEASGLDPSSPLCCSSLDVPAVCSELNWHLYSPLQCPCRLCQTHPSPKGPPADTVGLPSGCLSTPGGMAEFEFWLGELTELLTNSISLIHFWWYLFSACRQRSLNEMPLKSLKGLSWSKIFDLLTLLWCLNILI